MDGELEGVTENPRAFGGEEDPESSSGDVQATPEEQMDYEFLATRARKMIFGKSKEKILTMLGSSETPAKGLGRAGSMIIKSLMMSSKQQGKDISTETAINAAAVVLTDLNDLAKANGVFKYDTPKDEETEMSEGMLWGIKFYGDGMIANGEITPELQKMAMDQVKSGIAEETAKGPQKTKVAEAVGQAVSGPPQGLVSGVMNNGMAT